MNIMYKYHIKIYEDDRKNTFNYYGIVCAESYEKAMKRIVEYYISTNNKLISVTINSWDNDIFGTNKKEILDNFNAPNAFR